MLTPNRALFAIFALTSAISFAQTSNDSCAASPADQQFHEELAKSPHPLELLRKKLATDPDNLFLHRWLLENRQTEKGSLAGEYRKKLDQHPASVLYQYLYGQSLLGADTPQAIHQLNLAIAADPKMPWPYHALLQVYASPNFKDTAKLTDNLLTFNHLCPDVLSAYNFLRHVEEREKLRELTVRFRRSVESQNTKAAAASYRPLWAAEFRAADPSAFDTLRAQVAKDMERVKQLDPNNTDVFREGYKLTGNSAAANALPPPEPPADFPQTFNDVLNAWIKTHPFPKNASPKEIEAFYNDQLLASAQWVQDWPDSPSARYWRLDSLDRVKGTSNQDLEEAGNALIDTLKNHPVKGYYFYPLQASLAEIWSAHDIRLEQCLQLAEEALAQIDLGPVQLKPKDDMRPDTTAALTKNLAGPIVDGRFHTLTVETTVARKLKNFDKAATTLDQMKHLLDENPPNAARHTRTYLQQCALLAEAQGRKLDALTYYRLQFSHSTPHSEDEAHFHTLWKDLGGTDEGFKLWSSLQEPKRPEVADHTSPWTEINKPLTSLKAPDTNGKTWTFADLKGKTTLINVWATWCVPCRKELPDLQKLFEQVKDRNDIQVVSISVDSNPGDLAPFLKDTHYTFPVLAQPALSDDLLGAGGIPRTWIVDSNGSLRFEQLGYNPADWPQAMLQKITTLSLHP
jgi:peroxiredoxin